MGDCERAGWAKLIWRYQCGDPEAIRELAAQRGSLIVGLVLVLCAGIAREYDHEYIGDAPVFFLLPLFASLVIALLLYGSLRLFVLRNEIDPVAGRLVSFLSLFWLTAPLAWIYALPAERLLPPVAAAIVNLGLLATVASWRVWLLGRACALLFDASLPRVLAAILLPGSILVWVGSIASTLSLVSIMGGISLAPGPCARSASWWRCPTTIASPQPTACICATCRRTGSFSSPSARARSSTPASSACANASF